MEDEIEDLFDGLHYPGSKTPLRHRKKPEVVQVAEEIETESHWSDRPVRHRVQLWPGGPVEEREFFTIRALALALGRSQVTLRGWIDKKWLPDATYRTRPIKGTRGDGRRRLWTRLQIEAIVRIAEEEHLLGHNLSNSELVRSNFTAKVWEYLRTDPERRKSH